MFVSRIDDGYAIRTCWARAYGRQVNVGAVDGTDLSADGSQCGHKVGNSTRSLRQH